MNKMTDKMTDKMREKMNKMSRKIKKMKNNIKYNNIDLFNNIDFCENLTCDNVESYKNNSKFKNSILATIFNPLLSNFIKKSIGNYYTIIHICIMCLASFVVCFVNDINHLFILLIFLSINAFTNIILHDCPLTMLEKKYLNNSVVDERIQKLKNASINFETVNSYESQLEFIINASSLCIFKILYIMYHNFCVKNKMVFL